MSFLSDVAIAFEREMKPAIAEWHWIVFGLAQPMLYIILFVPLLGGVDVGTAAPLQWFVPGIAVMLTLFGTANVGWNLIEEFLSGSLDRLLTTRINRTAMVCGRALSEILPLMLQSAVLALFSLPFGLLVFPLEMSLGIVLLGAFSVGIALLSYSLALATRHSTPAFFMIVQTTTLPAMLTSGVLLPIETAPNWLYAVSRLNPLTYLVEAERALWTGNLASVSVSWGIGVTVATLAIGITAATCLVRRLSL